MRALDSLRLRLPGAAATPSADTRRYGRDAGFLGGALGIYGVLTYLYFAVASHTLGEDAYGDLVVLWAGVFIIVATLYRPVEQLLTRSIARHEAEGRSGGHEIRNAAIIQSLAALAFALAALAFRGPIEDELLSGSSTLYAIFIVAVLGYAASFFVRGVFAGNRRFNAYAVLLIAEAVSRFAMAIVVAIGLASGASTIALGIALGPAVSLLAVIPFLRRRAEPAADAEVPGLTIAQGSGFAIAVLFIMGGEQILINGGPLFVRLDEGTAAAGFIFNVLMLVRAPLLVFQAVATSLLPHLTRLSSIGDPESRRAFDESVRITLLAVAAFSAFVALVVLAAGPQLMQIAFGDNFDYPRLELLAMCPIIALYLGSWTLNQAAIARGRVRAASACWITAALVFVAVNLIPASDAVTRAEIGFGLASLTLVGLLTLVYRDGRDRPGDVPAAGSAEELEARIAFADETGT